MTARGAAYDAAAWELRAELLQLFREPLAVLDDHTFTALALRAFQYQYRTNAAYRAFCQRRERTPASTDSWTAIPVVPTVAFQELPLASGDPARAEAVFRTSGTTSGGERRGVRHVLDLTLYHAAAVPFFEACVLPDGAVLPFLSLMPSSQELHDSSLARMIDLVSDRLGAAGSTRFASVENGLDTAALIRRLLDAESNGAPVCLLGTSLAFVRLLEDMERAGVRLRLPGGSRLMDTGGYKGSERRFESAALRAWYSDRLGLEPHHCVNEYGMTELCSQFYDDALLRSAEGVSEDATQAGDAETTQRREAVRAAESRKIGPAWVRSRAVDPLTLEPVSAGDVGILQHFDLANLDAVIAVQTEDLAREVAGGFVLLGRSADAPPRGCSIAMDELMRAARDAR